MMMIDKVKLNVRPCGLDHLLKEFSLYLWGKFLLLYVVTC